MSALERILENAAAVILGGGILLTVGGIVVGAKVRSRLPGGKR